MTEVILSHKSLVISNMSLKMKLMHFIIFLCRETALYGNLILKKGVIPAELLQ